MDQQLRTRIKDWLAIPTRGEGQELLIALKLKPVTDLVHIKELLTAALQENVNVTDPIPPSAKKHNPPASSHQDTLAPYTDLLRAHSTTLLRERTTLHSQLELLNDSERFEAATRIKQITLELDDLWDQIREMQETGKIPEALLPGGSSYDQGVRDYKKYKAILSRISQLKRERNKSRGKNQKQQITARILKLEKEIQPLKEKFKELIL